MATARRSRRRAEVGAAAVLAAALVVASCAPSPAGSPPAPATVDGSRTSASGSAAPGTSIAVAGRSDRSSSIGTDTAFPHLGDPRLDVLHYDLSLRYDPDHPVLVGRERIDARVAPSTTEVNLDLRGLVVGAVRVDGGDAAFRQDDRRVTVALGSAVDGERAVTIDVDYEGTPVPVATAALGGVEVGWHPQPGAHGSFVLAEPEGASTWFAVNNHPLDKATYTFHVGVPRPYSAVANGRLDAVDDGAGDRTYHWRMDRPMASYLATVVTGDFEPRGGAEHDGITFENWLPSGMPEPASVDVAAQRDAVALLAAKLGPFPFDTYGAVVYPASFTPADDVTDRFMSQVAIETQGRSLYAEAATGDATVVHETAHQWFGDAVSITDWSRDLWWVEGFATFAQSIPQLDRDVEAWDASWQRRYRQAAGSWRPPGGLSVEDMFEWSYTGGSIVFWALWREVGDSAFWQTLRVFQDRHRYGNASTDDLVAAASEVAGRDLRPFFDSWLTEAEAPAPPAR